MKKEKISYICTEFDMNGYEMVQLPAETIDKIVKRQLSNGLSNFMMENMGKLPIEYMTNHKIVEDAVTHKAKMIIIDREELNRLKEIEWRYNDLCR